MARKTATGAGLLLLAIAASAVCGLLAVAAPDGALAQMTAPELSDHDAVWASLGL